MREVLNVISDQPRYQNSFDELIREVLEYRYWEMSRLEYLTGFSRTTLYRYRYNEDSPKDKIIVICVALGLDLVSTMIFLWSKGLTLNPKLETDRKYMIFIHKTENYYDIEDRVDEFYKVIRKNK